MFCENCGAQLDEGAKFCHICGAAVNNRDKNAGGVNNCPGNNSNIGGNTPLLDVKATGIVAYMTWIGFIVALCLGDRDRGKFYLNQALVFHIFSLTILIPFVGWAWSVFMLVCFILGVINAASLEEKELPLIGKIKILN